MDEKALVKFAKPDKVVRPRKRRFQRLPVIALYDGFALNEQGEIITEEQLLTKLPTMSARLFVRMDAAPYVASLDERYRKHYPGTWNCRFITKESNLIQANGMSRAVREQVVCHYFGWKTSGRGSFHKIVDPFIFLEQRLPKVDDTPYIRTLLNWGIALRDFCDNEGIEVRCTAGAVSGQFLTDPRFYPAARRKVPRATNDRVREHLPGNYYSLTVEPRSDREYTAYYLDQGSAHHYHAATTTFPCSDELYAYGRFTDVACPVFDVAWSDFHGLYCLDLLVPQNRHAPRWLRDWLDHRAADPVPLEKRYVYSNELPLLLDYGYKVIGVRAAWGSHQRDTGLNVYAKWSLEQLGRYNFPGIKRLLLATYGVLAITPRDSVSLYARATKGELASVRIGPHTFTGHKLQQRVKLEPRIANVLHRGMIEAACRMESISYADWLEIKGYNVLSIYSDAVIVEVNEDLPIPLTPDPWRLKRTLHHLRFINTQAYQSAEETKIPGSVGREILGYLKGPRKAPRPRKVSWAEQT